MLGRVNDWLNGNASLGWLDPEISGSHMIPFTRRWTLNLGANWDYPVSSDVNIVGNINYRLERGGYMDVANTEVYQSLDKLDATAGIGFGGSARLVAYIKNATDDRPVQFQFGNGAVATTLGRTYGVELSERF